MQISSIRPDAFASDKPKPTGAGGIAAKVNAKEIQSEQDDAAKMVAHFLQEAEPYVQQLRDKFGDNMAGGPGKTPLIVSDVLDKDGNQYVNLVQKGGGVLGIALVGYTYVLEQAGIRFLRMAGTSAGAINTSLMTAIGDPDNPKAEAKSPRLLDIMARLNMFSFVDGHPFAKWMIRNLISDKNFEKRMSRFLGATLAILVLLFLASNLLIGLERHATTSLIPILTKLAFVLTGFALLIVIAIAFHMSNMLTRLKNSGYGINPGNAFLNWIKEQLDNNGVSTISALEKKATTLPPSLHHRITKEPLNNSNIGSDVTFITSELVSQNKIEFPRMWKLFRASGDENSLHPGEFVRASMSIPFFFESYIISNIDREDKEIQAEWKTLFGVEDKEDIPENARFIDGGVLSNFPLNIFYNPKVAEARVPNFGIDLNDSEPEKNVGSLAASWSLGSYCGRMLNTIRFYYDKDFLIKNSVYRKGVGEVILYGPDKNYNWLDFFLSDKTKLDLFLDGAKAASEFLLKFDWEEYKTARRGIQESTATTTI